jgi:tetratricopeptide (TPR) repeat protein
MKPTTSRTAKFLLSLALIALTGMSLKAQSLDKAIRLTRSELFDKAEEMFNQLIASEPANGVNYFYAGDNYLRSYLADTATVSIKEAVDKAQAKFQKGTEMDAANPLCFVGLGKIAIFNGDMAGAKTYFDKAIAKFPSKTNKTSTLSKEMQAITYTKIAEALICTGLKDVPLAMSNMEKAVALDTKNADIYLIYGDVYLENNDGSNAISMYKMAQSLNPESPSAKLRLGKLWVRAKNWQEAISYYKEAIAIDSTFAPAYLELGVIYMRANQNEKAKANFKKYLELSGNLNAKRRYVSVLIDTKDYAGALVILNEIVTVDSLSNDINRAFAYCYFETGKFDKAIVAMEKFFRLAPADKILISDYSYYGKILSKNGKDSLAVMNFRKVISMDPSNCDVLSDIAAAYNKMKNYTEAAKYYEMKIARTECKASFADYYNLGRVYYSFGQSTKDRAILIKADTTFSYITNGKPDFQGGKSFFYRALITSTLDTVNNTAKPYFETYINYAKVDSVKNAKDLVICYGYLASYYYFTVKDYCTAIGYWERIIGLDPKNENTIEILKTYRSKCPEKNK